MMKIGIQNMCRQFLMTLSKLLNFIVVVKHLQLQSKTSRSNCFTLKLWFARDVHRFVQVIMMK